MPCLSRSTTRHAGFDYWCPLSYRTVRKSSVTSSWSRGQRCVLLSCESASTFLPQVTWTLEKQSRVNRVRPYLFIILLYEYEFRAGQPQEPTWGHAKSPTENGKLRENHTSGGEPTAKTRQPSCRAISANRRRRRVGPARAGWHGICGNTNRTASNTEQTTDTSHAMRHGMPRRHTLACRRPPRSRASSSASVRSRDATGLDRTELDSALCSRRLAPPPGLFSPTDPTTTRPLRAWATPSRPSRRRKSSRRTTRRRKSRRCP